MLFDLEEPEVIKHEIIQEDLLDANTSECIKDTENKAENKTKKIVRTLFPKQWKNHFGCRTEEVVLLHRVKYCGNWDVLRLAKTVEGIEVISENLLKKLDNNQYEADIQDIIKQLCSYKGVEIIEGHLMPDHIHMLVSIPPKISVSSFMGYLKGKSVLMIFDKHTNLIELS